MCEVEFVVPFRLEDLFADTSRQYTVQESFSKQSITVEVLQLKRSMYEDLDGFIFKYFDLYCNLIRQFSGFDDTTKITAFKVLLQVSEKMIKSLDILLEEETDELDQEICFTHRNMLKMCIYLLCQFSHVYEEEVIKKNMMANVAKGKKKKSVKDSEINEWPEERLKFLVTIKKIFRLPIKMLWNPPIVEHELINFVTNAVFKLLENTEVTKDKAMKMEIFRFLGTVLYEYRTGLAFSIRILQLAQDYEHLPLVMAEAVVYFVQECSADTLVSDICREASLLDMKTLTQNLTAAHSLSTFLMAVCEKCPEKVLAIIGSLLQFLEWESHVMRNCALSIIGTLLDKVLANENLSDKQRQIREELLDKLEVHLLDVNSFVRSKAIQTLKMLLDEKALASVELYRIGLSVSKRLKDKASNVRKNAMSFLAHFIEINQSACQVPLQLLKESYEKELEKLKEMQKCNPYLFEDTDEDEPTGENKVQEGVIFNDSDDDTENEAKEVAGGDAPVDGEPMEGDSVPCEDANKSKPSACKEDFEKQQAVVAYLKNTLNFTEVIYGIVTPICTLLHSSTQTDVLEAIEFFTAASGSLVNGLDAGIREILNLVWSKEVPIREAALNAFKSLYLKNVQDKRDVAEIVRNLLLLLQNATTDDVINLEVFIQHFCKFDDIPPSVSSVLWTNFNNPSSSTTKEEKISILILLSMVTGVKPAFVMQNFDAIVEKGLGIEAENDFQQAACVFRVLTQLNKNKRGKFDSIRPTDLETRFMQEHIIAERVKYLLVEGIKNYNDDKWTEMANEAISALFALIEEPLSVCEEICISIANYAGISFMQQKDQEGNLMENYSLPNIYLARYLSLCGHIALHYMSYLKIDYFAVLRREELYREQRRRKSLTHSASCTPKFSKSKSKSTRRKSISKEYKLVPPTDEETTYEQVLEMCAKEVLDETKLVGSLLPLVVGMCQQTLREFDRDVQAAAATALSKFMLLGEKVCANNMQLFATITEKSPEAYIRANMIAALGDLSTSFPNVVEPWIPQIFHRLSDSEPAVREASIIILTHLILHDFVRVKSLISEAAKCLADPEETISNVAKYLFSELSKKGNIIYNIIPDIISSLSDPRAEFSEEKFQIVLKHMLQYVEKEKLVEGLVEKLCCRFADSSTEVQLHELTFCLSILTLNDKCYSKLTEFKNFLKERMSDPIIMRYITNITANAKKNDAKTAAELETFRKELGL